MVGEPTSFRPAAGGNSGETQAKGLEPVSRVWYAFNITRQSFINLGVTVADTPWARLRGLLGKMRMRSDEGLWLVPSRGIHTLGLMFPIDAIYLDGDLRVVHLVENLGPLGLVRCGCAVRVSWNCRLKVFTDRNAGWRSTHDLRTPEDGVLLGIPDSNRVSKRLTGVM